MGAQGRSVFQWWKVGALVEVAAGDGWQARLGDPRKQRVAVEELEAVDERGEALGLGRKRCGLAHRGERLLGRIGVGGDQGRSLGARRGERRLQAGRHLDEAPQPDGDRVAGTARVGVVVGQLEARQDEQTIKRVCAGGLGVDNGEVALKHLRTHVPVGFQWCGR